MTSRTPVVQRPVPAIAAVACAAATLACLLPPAPALAAAPDGQAVANDYGQSDAEVAAEIQSAVDANAAVIRGRAAAISARTVYLARYAAETKARTAYAAALKTRAAPRITSARNAVATARAATLRARTAYLAALRKRNAAVTSVTAAVRATHYRPVDGSYDGSLRMYLVPTSPKPKLEPMQVHITVYGGHVSDVTVVKQADVLSDSNSYNQMSLSTLMLETMNAADTANVAAVTGASLTSEAFAQSLQAALVAAGYKA
jgi:uncharacterized protein with FMN-binding domain